MKKSTEKPSVNMRTVEHDLKKLLQSEEDVRLDSIQEARQPVADLEQALQLFDQLRARRDASNAQAREINWTHPSVLLLNEPNPIQAIIERARRRVFEAMEQGWSGPPYNPFTLAEISGMKLLPTEAVLDARTRSEPDGRFRIEFNPQRPPARMRYSIAHEIGHTLFSDCANAIRNRATHEEMKDDDWQLEALCNIAAAEILMPFGTLQDEISMRPNVGLILDLRRKYLVSAEAVVNRLIRLSTFPCLAFIARFDSTKSRHFIEYRIPSRALRESPIVYRGYSLPLTSKASNCIAIGMRQHEDASWISGDQPWFVEYLGISPNTGETYPRVLGLAFPPFSDNATSEASMNCLIGDAAEPVGAEQKLLLQMVNDQALFWGGGFAKQAGKKWPHAQAAFRQWAFDRRNLKLGNIHSVPVRQDLILVSVISQRGLRPASGPRLRYGALFSALEKVAELASRSNATVHMPRIGTGDAGGSWNVIEGIIRETLISRGVKVTIYELHRRSETFPRQSAFEFPKDIVDEVF